MQMSAKYSEQVGMPGDRRFALLPTGAILGHAIAPRQIRSPGGYANLATSSDQNCLSDQAYSSVLPSMTKRAAPLR